MILIQLCVDTIEVKGVGIGNGEERQGLGDVDGIRENGWERERERE